MYFVGLRVVFRRQLTSANERSEKERQHAFDNEEKVKELEETFGNRIGE